jgi:prepilin-type N-terminal cleavage/methylation domain-containing protein
MKHASGFTLIELLVVVAIISLIASVIVVSLNAARIRSNDAKRKADARVLVAAIDLYFQDNLIYPGTNTPGSAVYINDSFLKSFSGLSSYLTGKIPNDPTCSPTAASTGPTACTTNYQYIVPNGQAEFGLYIGFQGMTPCKFISKGGSQTWFASAPLCTYQQ